MLVRLAPLAIAVGLMVQPAWAQPNAPISFQDVQGSFRELVNEDQPVSGTALIGMSMVVAPSIADTAQIYVYVPRRFRGEIEFNVSTSDSRYVASGVFSVGRAVQGWVPITYPHTAGVGMLASYNTDQVAVRAVQRPGGQPLLVRWGAADATTLQIQINSERSESFVPVRGEGGPRRLGCDVLPAGVSIRFDTVCRVPVASLQRGQPIRVIRRRGAAYVNPPVEINVDLPGR